MEIYRSETELLSRIDSFLPHKKKCRQLQISPIVGKLEQSSHNPRFEQKTKIGRIIGGPNVRNKKIGCPQKM